MRKGLTLIELILSMVIIGIVFTVIPRLIMSMNQSANVTIKEEAMYNALTMIGAIINLPWDENNTMNDQLLRVTDGENDYNCTSSGYRIGGFIGSRNCRPSSGDLNLTASLLGHDNVGNDDFNDIDDYYDINKTADKNCSGGVKGLYGIATSVAYVQDPTLGSIDLNTTAVSGTTNTKYVKVQVGYGSDSQHTGCITALEYHSFNLGNIQINSRNW